MTKIFRSAQPPARRRKRFGTEVREEGLAAARKLLLAGGPGAVTVASVGQELGMSHANVLHHFGSAAALQSALMGSMIRDLTVALDHVVEELNTGVAPPRSIVDRVFDAFDEGGAGPLAAWIVLTGDIKQLEPVRQAVRSLVDAIIGQTSEAGLSDAGAPDRVRAVVLMMAVCAFGDSVIGPYIRDMLGQPDDAMRVLLSGILPSFLAPPAD